MVVGSALAVAAAAGCLDDERVARRDQLLALAVQEATRAECDGARRARFTTEAALGRVVNAIESREEVERVTIAVTDLDDLALAAIELPGAAAAFSASYLIWPVVKPSRARGPDLRASLGIGTVTVGGSF